MRTKRTEDEERTKWRDERRMEKEREVHSYSLHLSGNSDKCYYYLFIRFIYEVESETTIEKISARSLFDTLFNTLQWKTHAERMKSYDNYKMKLGREERRLICKIIGSI